MIDGICTICQKKFKFFPSNKSGRFCGMKCYTDSPESRKGGRKNKGKKHSEETKKKMSLIRIGKKFTPEHIRNLTQARLRYFESHPKVSPINSQIRNSQPYSEWRKKIFKRDGHTCVQCRDSRGGNLEADHITPLAFLIDEAILLGWSTAIFDLSNGQTLCTLCHKKTSSYGKRKNCFPENKVLETIKIIWEEKTDRKEPFPRFYENKVSQIGEWLKEKYLN